MIDSPNLHSPPDNQNVDGSVRSENATEPPSTVRGVAAAKWSSSISIFVLLFLHCQCGHIPMFALTFSGTAFALGVIARRNLRTRYSLCVFGMSIYILAQNLADVLWLGHDPFFRTRF
jgi:hypothetical protein